MNFLVSLFLCTFEILVVPGICCGGFQSDLLKMQEGASQAQLVIFFVQAHFALFVIRKLLVKANMVRVQGNKI